MEKPGQKPRLIKLSSEVDVPDACFHIVLCDEEQALHPGTRIVIEAGFAATLKSAMLYSSLFVSFNTKIFYRHGLPDEFAAFRHGAFVNDTKACAEGLVVEALSTLFKEPLRIGAVYDGKAPSVLRNVHCSPSFIKYIL